jgi:hypothetical protein
MFNKKIFMAVLAITGALAVSMNAYAAEGGWRQDTNGKWWYATNADGTEWHSNGWSVIDTNHDGMAECYYFDAQGYMYADTTTPDGYTVNADGQWTVDGVVQSLPFIQTGVSAAGTLDTTATTTTQAATASVDYSNTDTITTTDSMFRTNWLSSGAGAALVVEDNGGYNEQGVSNSLLYMYTHSKEENKKFGELLVLIEAGSTTVYYKNGFRVDYPNEGCGTSKGAYQDSFFTPNPDYSYSFKYWKNTSAREIGDRLLAEGVFTKDQLSYRNAGDTNLYIDLPDGSILKCGANHCGF